VREPAGAAGISEPCCGQVPALSRAWEAPGVPGTLTGRSPAAAWARGGLAALPSWLSTLPSWLSTLPARERPAGSRVGTHVLLRVPLCDTTPSPADPEAAERRARLRAALPQAQPPQLSSHVAMGLGKGSLPCSCPCCAHFPNPLQESDGLLPTQRCQTALNSLHAAISPPQHLIECHRNAYK